MCGPGEDSMADRLAKIKQWEEDSIKKYGFYAHMVFDAPLPQGYMNIHTHGFEQSWQHPDIQIVLNLGQQTAMHILHKIADRVRAGEFIKIDQDYPNFVGEYSARFISAKECGRTVLRLVIPDKHNNLDREKMEPLFQHQYDFLETD